MYCAHSEFRNELIAKNGRRQSHEISVRFLLAIARDNVNPKSRP